MLCPNCKRDMELLSARGVRNYTEDRSEVELVFRCPACKLPEIIRSSFGVSATIIEGLNRYVVAGVPTGDFLQAVLENNLREAFARADQQNFYSLGEIVRYVYNQVPADAWGSPERVKNWLAMHQRERETQQSVQPEGIVHNL